MCSWGKPELAVPGTSLQGSTNSQEFVSSGPGGQATSSGSTRYCLTAQNLSHFVEFAEILRQKQRWSREMRILFQHINFKPCTMSPLLHIHTHTHRHSHGDPRSHAHTKLHTDITRCSQTHTVTDTQTRSNTHSHTPSLHRPAYVHTQKYFHTHTDTASHMDTLTQSYTDTLSHAQTHTHTKIAYR